MVLSTQYLRDHFLKGLSHKIIEILRYRTRRRIPALRITSTFLIYVLKPENAGGLAPDENSCSEVFRVKVRDACE